MLPTAYGRGSTISRAPNFWRSRCRRRTASRRASPSVHPRSPARVAPRCVPGGRRSPATRPRRSARRDWRRGCCSRSSSIALEIGRVDLVDDHDIGHAQVGFAGVVASARCPGRSGSATTMCRSGSIEGEVVVAAVPHDDVGLCLRLPQDGRVVDARVDDRAADDVRLVFLALLDGAVMRARGRRASAKRCTRCADQIAVRHRMADDARPCRPRSRSSLARRARRLALARAGAHGADGDDRLAGS